MAWRGLRVVTVVTAAPEASAGSRPAMAVSVAPGVSVAPEATVRTEMPPPPPVATAVRVQRVVLPELAVLLARRRAVAALVSQAPTGSMGAVAMVVPVAAV